ncbi:MAG TPA: hypothetical protein VKB96_02655 [Gammaproteobacteria bacterium]|nr:hypothetical protein [Gammaproteobacteria bacterium]
MADDREGAYRQTDQKRDGTARVGGLDLEHKNVYLTPKWAGLIRTYKFIGVEERLSVKISIGGSIQMGVERQGSGAPAPSVQIHKLKLFLDQKLSIGESRSGAHLYW